jgi:hypothetical protein
VRRGVVPAQIAALLQKLAERHPTVTRLTWAPCPCSRRPECSTGYAASGTRGRAPGPNAAGPSDRPPGGKP